jgi:hypothetical protein
VCLVQIILLQLRAGVPDNRYKNIWRCILLLVWIFTAATHETHVYTHACFCFCCCLLAVWTLVGLTVIDAAIVIPVLLWCQAGSLAATWVAPILVIGLLCGSMGGLMTSIGPQVFPAGVRVSCTAVSLPVVAHFHCSVVSETPSKAGLGG